MPNDVQILVEQLRSDPTLRDRLRDIPDADGFFAAAERIAAERGLAVTQEQLRTEWAAAIPGVPDELTDQELEAVAGGGMWEVIKRVLTIAGGTCSRTPENQTSCYSGTSRA